MRAFIALLLLCAPLAEARDRAVLVYPRERPWFRRVFYTHHQRDLVHEIAKQYDVSVHKQIATDEALFAIDVDGAKLLVISGHGDPYSIYMNRRSRRTLDHTDRARLKAFFARLDPHATIVLQSCRTGLGFAHQVKEAAGPSRRVIAARGIVPWNGLRITSLAPFDVAMHCRGGGDCTVRLP